MDRKQKLRAAGEFIEGLGDAIHQLGYRMQKDSGLLRESSDTDGQPTEDRVAVVHIPPETMEEVIAPEPVATRQYMHAKEYEEAFKAYTDNGGVFNAKDIADVVGVKGSSVMYQLEKNPRVVELSREDSMAESQRRGQHLVAGITPRFFRYDGAKGKRKPPVKMTPAQLRTILIGMPKVFTKKQAAEKANISETSFQRWAEELPEVVFMKDPDTLEYQQAKAVYESLGNTLNKSGPSTTLIRFDPTIGAPDTTGYNPPPPERERIPMHPKRAENPNAKPQLGGNHKGIQDIIDAAWDQGFWVERTGGGHVKYVNPSGSDIRYTSQTPRTERAVMDAKSDLRKLGLVID